VLDKKVIDQYEPTIGIECHVQLKTKTKLFSAVSNDAVGKEPNTVVSPICFGMPGVLPVLNEAAVKLAIRAGIALNAEVAIFSKFDRKHYFYPDLPKGYQITQFDEPIVGKGYVDVPEGDDFIRVGITRAHLEEDAGKSTHPKGADYSLVDLNRAGTPLLEIVSEPDMHSARIARAYAQELYFLMKYADVSNVDLFHGNMRFDVNVSVAKKGSKKLGIRSEVKNINSFKAVEKSVEYEIKRQIELLEKGQAIVQETRGWDDAKQKTLSQRTKEDSHDYRYFPEPDLPPIVITTQEIEEVRVNMPQLPSAIRVKLKKIGLNSSQIETLLSREELVNLQLEVTKKSSPERAKRIANWLTGEVQASVSEAEYDWSKFSLDSEHLIVLEQMVEANELSSTGAKEVLLMMLGSNKSPKDIAKDNNLLQVSDRGELDKAVAQVIADNPQAAKDVKNGEMKAIGFLVGQVMKLSKGQANPQIVQSLVKEHLGV